MAGLVNEQVFRTGSQPMEMTRLSFGGDALNEAEASLLRGMEQPYESAGVPRRECFQRKKSDSVWYPVGQSYSAL